MVSLLPSSCVSSVQISPIVNSESWRPYNDLAVIRSSPFTSHNAVLAQVIEHGVKRTVEFPAHLANRPDRVHALEHVAFVMVAPGAGYVFPVNLGFADPGSPLSHLFPRPSATGRAPQCISCC